MTVYVNADWTAVVPEDSLAAAFGVQAKDLARLGLATDAPEPSAPSVLTSANEPEAKEADQPADKAMPKPADKAVRKPLRK